MTERQWMVAIMDAAKVAGWRCYHPWTSIHSNAGFPDLVCVRERVIWLELKREGLQLTGRQRAWCDALRGAGAEVYAPCWPSHADEIYAALGYPAVAIRDDAGWGGP